VIASRDAAHIAAAVERLPGATGRTVDPRDALSRTRTRLPATAKLHTNGNPDLIDVAVGARLRLRRRELNWSQTMVGDALGISFQQVQKYGRGANRISASVLVKAAEALRSTVTALVGADASEPVEPVSWLNWRRPTPSSFCRPSPRSRVVTFGEPW